MTRLLVSVRSGVEAGKALAGGATVIDVKEPSRGALGRPTAHQVDEVIAAVGGQAPISVALGDLRSLTGPIGVPASIRYVKSAVTPVGDWRTRLAHVAEQSGVARLIVVLQVDQAASARELGEQWNVLLDWTVLHGAAGVLLDTEYKDRGNLFAVVGDPMLRRWIAAAREAGRLISLAGGLDLAAVARAASLGPDVVGVRGAACVGGRVGTVDVERVRALASICEEPPRLEDSPWGLKFHLAG